LDLIEGLKEIKALIFSGHFEKGNFSQKNIPTTRSNKKDTPKKTEYAI
jgi:hypothetical protein